jgi:hypothetical protein
MTRSRLRGNCRSGSRLADARNSPFFGRFFMSIKRRQATLNFKSSVKGRIAETLVSCLLQHAGYRVLPLGIEHSVRELKVISTADPEIYHSAPEAIRRLPDFVVLDTRTDSPGCVVEVKFRKRWPDFQNPKLIEILLAQARAWPRLRLIAFLGLPFQADTRRSCQATPENLCRVFDLCEHEQTLCIAPSSKYGSSKPLAECDWAHGQTLQRAFPHLSDSVAGTSILRAVKIMHEVSVVLDKP